MLYSSLFLAPPKTRVERLRVIKGIWFYNGMILWNGMLELSTEFDKFHLCQTRDFWREAQILSKLHHPNVVAFYGVVPDGAGGTLATVTEYMVNGSLRNVLLKKDR